MNTKNRTTTKKRVSIIEREEFILPEVLNLADNYDETITSLGKILALINRYRGESKYYWINGEKVKEFSPAAILILAANLHVLTMRKKIKWKGRNNHGFSPQLIDIFTRMGFFKLLRIKKSHYRVPNKHSNKIKFINFISARADRQTSQANNNVETRKIVEELMAIQGNSPGFAIYLSNVLDEAIINVAHHAYLPRKEKDDTARWWITASQNKKKKELQVICYDRGQTIPVTLNKSERGKGILSKIKNIFGKTPSELTDGELLKVAVETLRTSTHTSGRGRGLGELMTLIRHQGEKGMLKIYSGEGMVSIEQTGGSSAIEDLKIDSKDLPCKFRGTLIIWSIIETNTRG